MFCGKSSELQWQNIRHKSTDLEWSQATSRNCLTRGIEGGEVWKTDGVCEWMLVLHAAVHYSSHRGQQKVIGTFMRAHESDIFLNIWLRNTLQAYIMGKYVGINISTLAPMLNNIDRPSFRGLEMNTTNVFSGGHGHTYGPPSDYLIRDGYP